MTMTLIDELVESAEVFRGGDEGDTWFARADTTDVSWRSNSITGTGGSRRAALAQLRYELECELEPDDRDRDDYYGSWD